MATSKRRDYCCVPLCNSDARKDSTLSFHTIPKNPQVRKQWILKIRRDPGNSFTITPHTVVCSKHFTKDDFKWTPNRKTLKAGTVPSIFHWTQSETGRKPPSRKIMIKHPIDEDKENSVDAVTVSDANGGDQTGDPLQPTRDTDPQAYIQQLHKKIHQQQQQLKEKDVLIEELQRKIELEKFGISRFMYDNKMIEFYTGFPSFQTFQAFFNFIKPSACNMRGHYDKAEANIAKPNSSHSIPLIDELFMFLCRLKAGLSEVDLSVRFNCHVSTISRRVLTWCNFLYFVLGSINIWPPASVVMEHMPAEFKLLYPKTRVIIDCTEIYTERPSSVHLGSQMYSHYKSRNTWKGLVGIAPHGALTFVSSLYSGCMSDIELTKHSGLLDLVEAGDEIMGDKGFLISKLLEGTGVSINTPHFLSSDGQFNPSEIEENQQISSHRIHIERHIKRVKEYHLLNGSVPLSMAGSVNQLWTIANLLTLFRRPLIGK